MNIGIGVDPAMVLAAAEAHPLTSISMPLSLPGMGTESVISPHQPLPPPPLAEGPGSMAIAAVVRKEHEGDQETAPLVTATAQNPNPRPPTGPTDPPLMTMTTARESIQQQLPLPPQRGDTTTTTTATAMGLAPTEAGTTAPTEEEEAGNDGEASASTRPQLEHSAIAAPPPIMEPSASPTTTPLTAAAPPTAPIETAANSVNATLVSQRHSPRSTSASSSNTGAGSRSRLVDRRGSLPVHVHSVHCRASLGGAPPPFPMRTSPRTNAGMSTIEGDSKAGAGTGTLYDSLRDFHRPGGPILSTSSPTIPRSVRVHMPPPFPPPIPAAHPLLAPNAPEAPPPLTGDAGATLPSQAQVHEETTKSDHAARTTLTSSWAATVGSPSPSLSAPLAADPASSTTADNMPRASAYELAWQARFARHQSLPGGSLTSSSSPTNPFVLGSWWTSDNLGRRGSGGAPSPTNPSFAGHRAHPYAGTEREREREREREKEGGSGGGGGVASRRRSVTDPADKGKKNLVSRRSIAALGSTSETGELSVLLDEIAFN